MQIRYQHIECTPSTNDLLVQMLRTTNLQSGFVLIADFQSNGRGQAGNIWETECGKNLTFSILFRPKNLTVDKNFILSQATALAIKSVLDEYLPQNSDEKFKIKWSNDIYWRQQKICGILIENTLKGKQILYSIIGIGLNINQLHFSRYIINPISLCQITGKQIANLNDILRNICQKVLSFLNDKNNYPNIKLQYFNALYRNDGFHNFRTNDNIIFFAKIVEIQDDGKMILETSEGGHIGFYYKEIMFA
ncbi:MAG: biotin--[acetyl-CoA-carboxylase] ligase [Paludibacter sp.]|nr:biotin--[acetyl-CoA-carboxylase] ligase [Paludibacter sp.]